MKQRVGVVGGGIVGLAHAWAAARRGHTVVLVERDRPAQGASVRNFGMVWPVGQPAGAAYQLALRGRERWLEAAPAAGIDLDCCGSLHLAYRPDEWAVLEEFVAARRGDGLELLTAGGTLARAPAVCSGGLLGALWSPAELCVDPRQAVARLTGWLREAHGVAVHQGTVVEAAPPRLAASDGRSWPVDRVVVCSGADLQSLYPGVLAGAGLRRCKLQMLRTAPQPGGWRLGPMLAGGLTLRHYAAFADCPSLPALRRRVAAESSELDRYGIHVMAAQNARGEVVIGDSHEYDGDIEPFDKSRIDELILDYLRGMVRLPDWTVAQRWHGVYAKHPTLPQFTARPAPGVLVATTPGGAGMTLAFGLADELWERWEE
jgi:FAD dependent oxidoreductase TIGR03364